MKANNKLTFRDVYQLPLTFDDYSRTFVWSRNNVMTFNQLLGHNTENYNKVEEILDIINGDSKGKFDKVEYKNFKIYINDVPIFLLRGWGYLTGIGTLNLDAELAANIQDSFAEWVVNKLKGIE